VKKIIERILVFCIGVPAVFSLIFLLPHYNYLVWNIIITVFSAIGAMEFASMLNKKQFGITKINACILGALPPLYAILEANLHLGDRLPLLLIAVAGWILISLIFSRNANMDTVIHRLAGYFAVMIYPGFFMYWLVKISGLWITSPSSSDFSFNSGIIIMFFVIVFANDSLAWLSGNLFGRNNRGLIPASPNKSIAGFIGGVIGCVAMSFIFIKIFPFLFTFFTSGIVSAQELVILSFCTGIAATLGDLTESAIKRSCDVKDSGNIMLGRGGILDSIDSIAIAAPVYFVAFTLLFHYNIFSF
jgi:phosphatidate cytidylyltransferase